MIFLVALTDLACLLFGLLAFDFDLDLGLVELNMDTPVYM